MGSFMSLKITFNKPFVEIDVGISMGSFKNSEVMIGFRIRCCGYFQE